MPSLFEYDPQLAIEHLSQVDSSMGRVIREIGDFTLTPHRGTIFDGLLKSIVYQQLSGKAAATIHRRLLDQLPPQPTARPLALLRLSDDEIRAAGISRAKLLAIRDLASRTTSGELPDRRRLRKLSDEQIIDALTAVRGVGRWTAEMILIFWLGRPDVLPVLDLGVRRGYSLAYQIGEMPKPKELEAIGDRWRPFRSVAAWYLWRVADRAKGEDVW